MLVLLPGVNNDLLYSMKYCWRGEKRKIWRHEKCLSVVRRGYMSQNVHTHIPTHTLTRTHTRSHTLSHTHSHTLSHFWQAMKEERFAWPPYHSVTAKQRHKISQGPKTAGHNGITAVSKSQQNLHRTEHRERWQQTSICLTSTSQWYGNKTGSILHTSLRISLTSRSSTHPPQKVCLTVRKTPSNSLPCTIL